MPYSPMGGKSPKRPRKSVGGTRRQAAKSSRMRGAMPMRRRKSK